MTTRRSRTLLAGALAGTLLTGTVALALAAPAEAASRVTVRNDRGGAQADTTYQTKLTISGTGFQVVQGGFGGVYLMFGWVDDPTGGSWRPSKGGLTGDDYSYIPDSENAADNKGYLKFIAFPGSSTSSEANAVLSKSGGFSVDLTVPGPVFTSVDREGESAEVDCRKVTCGIITIGAHGVKSPANETFTPVRFGDVYGGAAPTTPAAPSATPSTAVDTTPTEAPSTDTGAGTATESPAPGATPPAASAGTATVTTDRATAVAGHALAFTGRGFTPGEQVLAILDNGVVATGPMVAGTSGEVAGLMQLPVELAVGTHELRLVGAASGSQPTEMFPVQAAPDAAALAASEEDDAVVARRAFLGVAAVVFLVALAVALVRLRRRPLRRKPAPAGPPPPTVPTTPATGATP